MIINKINKNFWKNKKVLITGHSGFKGSWLTTWLLKLGSEVCGVSLKPDDDNKLFINLNIQKDINHFDCDINNLEEIKTIFKNFKPEIVFHLAAQPLVRESYLNPQYTWQTNVIGTVNVLQSMKTLSSKCALVCITTDKVYHNNEWIYGYRENDALGGHDPYSSSKAAAELAIDSWRKSFFEKNNCNVFVASARSGNVIGGGDWSKDRIIPDVIKAIKNKNLIEIRNPNSTRPWQHVLEPLSGYMILAEKLFDGERNFTSAFNFGPYQECNKTVKELVMESIKFWHGDFKEVSIKEDFHEAGALNLVIDKSLNLLNWKPLWNFSDTVKLTIEWYFKYYNSENSAIELCLSDIIEYENN